MYDVFTTYFPQIYHIFTTYLPHIEHVFTTYLPHIYHILNTSLPHIDHIFTTYYPHIYHIFTTYLRRIYHVSELILAACLQQVSSASIHAVHWVLPLYGPALIPALPTLRLLVTPLTTHSTSSIPHGSLSYSLGMPY